MKVNEIVVEGWWDDLKRKITGKLTGPASDDVSQGLQRFDQNVQARLQPAYQEWAALAKNTQLPQQPGEDPADYEQRRAKYLSGVIKQFADEIYKNRQPSGGTRIPTPAFTGNEGPDLQAAKNYLTNRTKEYFSTINTDAAATSAQQTPTADNTATTATAAPSSMSRMATQLSGSPTGPAATMRVGGQTWQRVQGSGNYDDMKYYNPATKQVVSLQDLEKMRNTGSSAPAPATSAPTVSPPARTQSTAVTAPAAKKTTVPARQFRPTGSNVATTQPAAAPREKYMGPAQQVGPKQLPPTVRRLPR